MSKKPTLLFFIFLMICLNVSAQKKNSNYIIRMHKTSTPVMIDGVDNDAAWQLADSAKDFFMVLPMDTSFDNVKTEVKVVYDEHNFYLLAVCYKKGAGPNMVESLRRDFNFTNNDNFLVFIDPFEDETTGFSFGANANGAQWDGTMYAGGSVDLNWDNKWISAVKNYPGKYIFEAAIPFKHCGIKKTCCSGELILVAMI